MNQKINPFVAVVVILAIVVGAGWLIYNSTQPRMVDVPYKSPAQRAEEAKQAAAAMSGGSSRAAKGRKSKPTGQFKGEPKRESQSGQPPKPEQKSTQEN